MRVRMYSFSCGGARARDVQNGRSQRRAGMAAVARARAHAHSTRPLAASSMSRKCSHGIEVCTSPTVIAIPW